MKHYITSKQKTFKERNSLYPWIMSCPHAYVDKWRKESKEKSEKTKRMQNAIYGELAAQLYYII